MAKAILLVRVSTTKQEITTQTKELVDYAMADGYNKSDLIIIEGVGASAIKLNDVYLAEIDNLFSTIQNDKSINAVYAWEISRIGRNEEKLMQIKNFLIAHKVQLVIKNPSLRLLNNDGSVNNGVELAFSLFATMSKQEMEIKQWRFRRSKERNKAEGKYNGGRIKLGYKLDSNKYFIIDEEKAQVVRQIFDWYVNEGFSCKQIFSKLIEKNIYKMPPNFNTSGGQIRKIIMDKSYIGEGLYPQIIDVDTFKNAQDIVKTKKRYETKNIYYCSGLLVFNGYHMGASKGTNVYCVRIKDNYTAVNINVLDYIAEYSANILLAHYNSAKAQTNKNEYKLKVAENKNIIASKQCQIKEYEGAIERAINMNIMQPKYFPTEKMETVIKQNETVINKIQTEIADLQTENTRMQNWLNGEQQFINTIKGVSDAKKKEMINSVIKRIEVTKVEQRHFHIKIFNKIGYLEDSYYDYTIKGHSIHVKQIFEDGRRLDITPQINANKRFERKRYNGK